MRSIFLIILLTLTTAGIATAQTKDSTRNNKDVLPTRVDKPASFPGGANAWRSYLENNLKYPKKAMRNKTQGEVRVLFMIDEQGNISDAMALMDPGDGLAEEALRLVRGSGKWKPAEDKGVKVKGTHIQAIVFRLQ